MRGLDSLPPPSLMSQALRSAAPRATFSDELLHALENAPALLVELTDGRAERVRRLLLGGTVAGVVGVAGAAVYTVARRSRRRGLA